MMKFFLALLTAVCSITTARAGDFNYDAYKPASLASVAERKDNQKSDYLIDAGHTKYSVVATYTGRHRETVTTTKELVRYWVKSLRHPKEYESLFDHEVEIESGGKKYWLPIQNPLVEPFASEVQEGGSVKLYIMLIGGTRDRLVFSINEFQAQ